MVSVNKKTKITIIIVAGCVVLLSGFKSATYASTAENDSKAIAGSISEFAFNLYGRMKELPELKQADGNMFFSPYSISMALAMTYTGTRGNTAREVANVLRFPVVKSEIMPLERIAAAYSALQKTLQADQDKSGYQLNVANALWSQRDYSFWESFINLVNSSFRAGFNQVDFVAGTEDARQTINTWVEKQTKYKIKNLIPRGVLDSMTRLVLTNAIYFKGDWASQFKQEYTKPADFHVSEQKTEKVPMMYQKGTFYYGESESVQILEMPYKGNELSMMIVLPKATGSFDSFEKQFAANPFFLIASASKKKMEVEVYLPKFKLTCGTLELKEILREMGIKDAFSLPPADFSGMDGKMDLFISNVMHKAFVEVNEEGTEAAAATGVGISLTSVQPTRTPVFRADHPFIFLINDNRTNCILFMGRLMNPAIQGQ